MDSWPKGTPSRRVKSTEADEDSNVVVAMLVLASAAWVKYYMHPLL